MSSRKPPRRRADAARSSLPPRSPLCLSDGLATPIAPRRDEAVLEGPGHRARPAVETELREDALDVLRCRLRRDEQLLRDRLVRCALCEQRKDFCLTRGEWRIPRGRGLDHAPGAREQLIRGERLLHEVVGPEQKA